MKFLKFYTLFNDDSFIYLNKNVLCLVHFRGWRPKLKKEKEKKKKEKEEPIHFKEPELIKEVKDGLFNFLKPCFTMFMTSGKRENESLFN